MITPADILLLVRTKDEANEFQKQLDNLLNVLFTEVPFETLLREHISYEKQEKLLTLFSKERIDTKQLPAVQTCLQEIKKIIAQIPLLTLAIAFAPKQNLLEIIATWFLVNTKKPVLLDIVVNKNLIGGAVIEYKGLFKDYSLKRILEEKYQQGDLVLSA
ncbi:MAG TPA: F0F1 ATP synthase subunit delta [Candidatus Saccharimonadales bacterium]|nr:F0F1 ATP synthase subunit delta [Candidatus Saccharimonadales bacterium]